MSPRREAAGWQERRTTRLAVSAALVTAVALAAPAATGTGVPAEPVLRVMTGMHTAPIHMIAADAAGRFLATASDDKTLRVWDLSTGELLRTLRPPIGPGNEGKLYATAISPDGKLIAAGGWTGFEWAGNLSIYLFSRATGRLVRRIPGLPNVIDNLAFSADGKRLAASLVGNGGIWLFRVSDGGEMGRHTDCAGDSYGIDFDRDGRLLTTCQDGYLRLYNSGFKLIAKVKAHGRRPVRVRFSPGGRVAVGSYGSVRVEVLSAVDLRHLYYPDVSGLGAGDLPTVAWSADGRLLYAAGRFPIQGLSSILSWAKAGRGIRTELPAAANTILDLRALPRGRLAFGASDPSWGVLGATGVRELLDGPTQADPRAIGAAFRIDSSGAAVQFSFQPFGAAPATFRLHERALDAGPLDAPRTSSPRVKAPGLEIKDWQWATTPTLNGAPLQLQPGEESSSLAISPDGRFFLLGTQWWLRCLGRTGGERWKTAAPASVLAVNVSGDARTAVAAYLDGTLRWYRAADGKELLALFPHADRKRWVAWTPSGYYDASVGGEELIGWHVNRGPDAAADFFPASHFRDRFYRPDVVARILDTLDESKAVVKANAAARRPRESTTLARLLPPVVTLLAPTDGAAVRERHVAFRITVRSPAGEPITAVRAFVNGRPAAAARGLVVEPGAAPKRPDPTAEQVYAFRVPIPAHNCTVAIQAETRLSSSDLMPVKLRWAAVPAAVAKPALYVLAVGVGSYVNRGYRLTFPAKDAADVAQAWQAQKGKLYRKVNVRLLTDGKATRGAILDGLQWLEDQTMQQDVAVLFFAGHGITNPRTGEYLFLPYEADFNARLRTLLPDSDVRKVLAAIPGKVLLFLDTCHAGNLLGKTRSREAADFTRVVNELSSAGSGAVVFGSASGSQLAQESPAWGHGAFTLALLEAFAGKAGPTADGVLHITTIEGYLARRVKQLTHGLQTPVSRKPDDVQDFPVAVVVPPEMSAQRFGRGVVHKTLGAQRGAVTGSSRTGPAGR